MVMCDVMMMRMFPRRRQIKREREREGERRFNCESNRFGNEEPNRKGVEWGMVAWHGRCLLFGAEEEEQQQQNSED